VENTGRRPFIRRAMSLAIAVDTPHAKVQQAIQMVRDILTEEAFREPIHPSVGGQEMPPRAYFSDVTPDSLVLSVIYCYSPPDYWAYMEHAERLNLRILAELAAAGIALARPVLR
jgi:MscS family membrane protein